MKRLRALGREAYPELRAVQRDQAFIASTDYHNTEWAETITAIDPKAAGALIDLGPAEHAEPQWPEALISRPSELSMPRVLRRSIVRFMPRSVGNGQYCYVLTQMVGTPDWWVQANEYCHFGTRMIGEGRVFATVGVLTDEILPAGKLWGPLPKGVYTRPMFVFRDFDHLYGQR